MCDVRLPARNSYFARSPIVYQSYDRDHAASPDVRKLCRMLRHAGLSLPSVSSGRRHALKSSGGAPC